jgi:hypothetical protein
VFMPVKYRIVSDKKLNRKNTRTRAHLKGKRSHRSFTCQFTRITASFSYKRGSTARHKYRFWSGDQMSMHLLSCCLFRRERSQARQTALSLRPTPNKLPFPTTFSMWLPILGVCTCSSGESLPNKCRNEKIGGDVGVTWSMQ